MAINIPNLDIRDFQQLTDGLRSEIPKYTDQWTDYNLSDPGITIMEMLAWITETLAYRLNRIPQNTQRDFLYLLGGASADEIDRLILLIDDLQKQRPYTDPDYYDFLQYLKQISLQVKPDSGEMRTRAVSFYRAPYLAVTKQNFIDLTMQSNQILGNYPYRVGRALASSDDDIIYVRIVPVPADGEFSFREEIQQDSGSLLKHSYKARLIPYGFLQNGVTPTAAFSYLLKQVERFLGVRTLLGSAVDVSFATFTDIIISLDITLDDNLDLSKRIRDIVNDIKTWLGPVKGGDKGRGWTYNLMPDVAMITSFLLRNDFIRYVRVNSVRVDQDHGHLDSSIAIPTGQDAFIGFPNPTFHFTLSKLQRRQK